MRVGITKNEPWTVLEDSEPQGVEVDLIEAFARQLDAEIDWTVGAAEEILEATEEGHLDLAIGGFLADDPWATRVSFIQPYATVGEDQHVMATPHGENAWIVRLERFLRSSRHRLIDLLREHAS